MAENEHNAAGHGTLFASPRMAGGKKLDTWEFVPPDHGERHYISVHLKHTEHGLVFEAHSKHLNEHIEDANIERLRTKVTAWFERYEMVKAGVVWEDWIEIEVGGYNDLREPSRKEVSLSIKQNPIKRGVLPNGEVVTLGKNGHGISAFPKDKRAGDDDVVTGEGIFASVGRRTRASEFSYVPATPENLEAIMRIQNGLLSVRQNVADFMHKSHVMGAITGSTQESFLLTGPERKRKTTP